MTVQAPKAEGLHLSSVYNLTTRFSIVYHTQPGSNEVEFVTKKLFNSRKKALKWFKRNVNLQDYIEPEIVEVHLRYLGVTSS